MKTAVRSREEKNRAKRGTYWSAYVTTHSNALDLEAGVFTWQSPRKIAMSLKRSAEASHRRRGSAYQAAMSMLNLYANRAGSNLSRGRRMVLERAKVELRNVFGRHTRASPPARRGRTICPPRPARGR